MRAVVQRVSRAAITIDGVPGPAWEGPGLVVLLGVTHGDSAAEVAWMADRLARLRVFEEPDGRMGRTVAEAGGCWLVVSQFTLYGALDKGTRPSWNAAAPAAVAEPLYEAFVAALGALAAGRPVHTGRFGARMEIDLRNDGPVTLILERHPAARSDP